MPGNARELAPMVDAGVFGFTCGLASPSNGDAVSEADLRVAMPAIRRLGVPLLVHAEAPGPIDARRRAATWPAAHSRGFLRPADRAVVTARIWHPARKRRKTRRSR